MSHAKAAAVAARSFVEAEIEDRLCEAMHLRVQANSMPPDDPARTTLQSRIERIERRIVELCGY